MNFSISNENVEAQIKMFNNVKNTGISWLSVNATRTPTPEWLYQKVRYVVTLNVLTHGSILTFYYNFLEQDTDNTHIVGTTEGLDLSYI